jgi:hypothetical protein
MHDHDDDESSISESYVAKQRERDGRYQREYAEWINSMPPEERRKFKEMGLDKAYLPSGSGGATKDAAESSRACCEDCYDEHEERSFDEPSHHDTSSIEPRSRHSQSADAEGLHEALRRLVGEMLMQSNASLSLDCLALVTGLAYEGDTMTEIAKRHDVTRAAVSKRCVELTQSLNLKPSRAMRSLLARDSYRKARMNHLRIHP